MTISKSMVNSDDCMMSSLSGMIAIFLYYHDQSTPLWWYDDNHPSCNTTQYSIHCRLSCTASSRTKKRNNSTDCFWGSSLSKWCRDNNQRPWYYGPTRKRPDKNPKHNRNGEKTPIHSHHAPQKSPYSQNRTRRISPDAKLGWNQGYSHENPNNLSKYYYQTNWIKNRDPVSSRVSFYISNFFTHHLILFCSLESSLYEPPDFFVIKKPKIETLTNPWCLFFSFSSTSCFGHAIFRIQNVQRYQDW